MQMIDVNTLLEGDDSAKQWLTKLRLSNLEEGQKCFAAMARCGMTLDLIGVLAGQLEKQLAETIDPDLGLRNLTRFVISSRSPISLGALIERDEEALQILLKVFSSSQYLSDLLVRDPESFDLIRLTEGQPVTRQSLIDELLAEIDFQSSSRVAMGAFRLFKHRETLRIAYGDWFRGISLETTTQQLSYLAESIVQIAVKYCRHQFEKKVGVPRNHDGTESRFCVFGMEGLGGQDLGYANQIELFPVYEEAGHTDGKKKISNQEFFDRVADDVAILLSEMNDFGFVYRVRFYNKTAQGLSSCSLAKEVVSFFGQHGRAWDRMKLIRSRTVAGDQDFGEQLLNRLRRWVFRKFVNGRDLTELRSMRRRFKTEPTKKVELRNVRNDDGGLSDVEFTIQFLQLLVGNEIPALKSGSFFEAIRELASNDILSDQERIILENNYSLLRGISHQLQLHSDVQAEMLPRANEDMERLARQAASNATGFLIEGSAADSDQDISKEFMRLLNDVAVENRKILNHLLHEMPDSGDSGADLTDLVLDPDFPNEKAVSLLEGFGFSSPTSARKHLEELATERHRFISDRRCRHFLAAIIQPLLTEIETTPDPDITLRNLAEVSDSIGGKGSLWELFQTNRKCLHLYVTICANAPYLSSILNNNPGMLDELMDSLMLGSTPESSALENELAFSCRGTNDINPIVHGFKNSKHLQIGVRDLVRNENLGVTLRAIADVAECCLRQIIANEFSQLVEKFGTPQANDRDCDYAILTFGKVGGQEPNYHSDLNFLVVFDADGETKHKTTSRQTSNQHFFNQLVSKSIKQITRPSSTGRLYDLECPIFGIQEDGLEAFSCEALDRFFTERKTTFRSFLNLTQARIIHGSPENRECIEEIVSRHIEQFEITPEVISQVIEYRMRHEVDAGRYNLKRGMGGTFEIETIAQTLYLKHFNRGAVKRVSSTMKMLTRLSGCRDLDITDASHLVSSYGFLRRIESCLRLMDLPKRHSLPLHEPIEATTIEQAPTNGPANSLRMAVDELSYYHSDSFGDLQFEQRQLARLMGFDRFDSLVEEVESHKVANRKLFEKTFQSLRNV